MDPLSYIWVIEQTAMSGNAVGYTRANWCLRAALQAAGAVESRKAKLAVHMQMPRRFFPWFGKINCLFTMYENETMPGYFPESLEQADAVITPTEWNAQVFREVCETPIYVSPLGVNTDKFVGVNRPRPRHKPFRWFWCGAHNLRKGWKEVLAAWEEGGFINRDDCELYLKTTDQRRDVVQGANVIVDSRLLNDDGMVALYAEADAFVFPSCGEGWGLPLLEAMATGLPCLTILNTGITAFANDSVCIPIRSERQPLLAMDELSAQESKDPELVQKNQALLVTVDVARVDDLVRKMEWVMRHWAEAKRIGLRAWRHAQGFSWLKAGRRLMAVLREIEQGEGIHATDRVEAH